MTGVWSLVFVLWSCDVTLTMVLIWSGGGSRPCLPAHEGGLPDLQERTAGLVPGKTQSGGMAVVGARGGEFLEMFRVLVRHTAISEPTRL